MASSPIVSYIVPSYNYEKFVAVAIQSVIDQTVEDIEILVIDDASIDRSRQVIEGFFDPRIKRYVNEVNMGASATYNRGAHLAKGEYIAYLDSDDCMDPLKTERQLEYFKRNPGVDVVSTYLKCIDAAGDRHASLADTFEGWANQPHDFNVLDTWVVRCLVSVSVMHRRSLHGRVGFRDPAMTLADYDLWTRAFNNGCRFGIVQEPLLWRRRHGANADYSNPMRAFLELSFAMMKNLMPMTASSPNRHLAAKMIDWVLRHEQLTLMPEVERYRLLALLSNAQTLSEFSLFKAALADDPHDSATTSLGRHLHAVYSQRSVVT